MTDMIPSFPMLLQRFFVDHLRQQRAVSPSTVAAYRDTFKLLLAFAEKAIGKAPTDLVLADLDATLVLAFLDHLERERKNSVRSRNARLSAIRSFLKYAAHEDLTVLAVIERSLAVPQKRHEGRTRLPDPARNGGNRRGAGLRDMGRAARSGAVHVPLQHWRQDLRGDQPPGRRRGAGCLASRTPPRQGEKATKRPTLEGDGRYTPAVASPSADAGPQGYLFPAAQAAGYRGPARLSGSHWQSRRQRASLQRWLDGQSRRTRSATRRRCTCYSRAWISPSSRCGSVTEDPKHDAHLLGGGSRHERGCAESAPANRRCTGAVSPAGPAYGLPPIAVIMRSPAPSRTTLSQASSVGAAHNLPGIIIMIMLRSA